MTNANINTENLTMNININASDIVNAILNPENLSAFIASVKEHDPKTWDTLHSAACLRYIENNEATIEDKAVNYLLDFDLRHVARVAAEEYILEHEDEVRSAAAEQYINDNEEEVRELAVEQYINDFEDDVRSAAVEQYILDETDEVTEIAANKMIEDDEEAVRFAAIEWYLKVHGETTRDDAIEKLINDDGIRDLAASKMIELDEDNKISELAAKMYTDIYHSAVHTTAIETYIDMHPDVVRSAAASKYIEQNAADVQNDAVEALGLERAIEDIKRKQSEIAAKQRELDLAIAKLYI